YDISFSQVNGRAEMMKELCCFTSTKAANHLITLGEYAAMYLLSWSPALWETAKEANSFLSFDELLAEDKYYMDETLNTDKALETRRKKYEEQANTLAQFAISVPKIRRLMANLPVYMIFDDHDITDDWNISNDWMQKVGNAPLGRHVIANGLTAYWAFQAARDGLRLLEPALSAQGFRQARQSGQLDVRHPGEMCQTGHLT
ncbi:hypothetical protein ACWCP5_41060, partial [Streptomyces sp. NPDC002159]